MSKQIKISFNGQDEILEVGKFYFQKFYSEATGNDPLNFTEILVHPGEQFKFGFGIIYAGLKTHYKVEKKPFNLTKEQVEDIVGVMEETEIAKIISEYFNLQNPIEGEGEPHLNGAVVGNN